MSYTIFTKLDFCLVCKPKYWFKNKMNTFIKYTNKSYIFIFSKGRLEKVFIINLEQIAHTILLLPLLTLKK